MHREDGHFTCCSASFSPPCRLVSDLTTTRLRTSATSTSRALAPPGRPATTWPLRGSAC